MYYYIVLVWSGADNIMSRLKGSGGAIGLTVACVRQSALSYLDFVQCTS